MAQSTQYGVFVPTSYVWEVEQIQKSNLQPEIKELLVRLYQNINQMSLALNIKDTGQYARSEFVTGEQYFSNPANNSSTVANPALRQVYRKVIYYPTALPNTGTATIAHGIICSSKTSLVGLEAYSTDPTGFNYIQIPYASPTLASNIQLRMDNTNVYITTGSNRTNFTLTYIVIRYLQS
jgi:hypothetical protein